MNRKQFLKRLGIGAGVAVAAPAVLANIKVEEKWTHIEGEPEVAYDESYERYITPTHNYLRINDTVCDGGEEYIVKHISLTGECTLVPLKFGDYSYCHVEDTNGIFYKKGNTDVILLNRDPR